MTSWLKRLKYDPLPPLVGAGHPAVRFFAQKDLLDTSPGRVSDLWEQKVPQKIVRAQQKDGSWKYPGKTAWCTTDYSQLETYREVGFLVRMYGFDRTHPAIQNAAEFFFSKQSDAGDFRGIYANQYSPNYTAAIAELLTAAGYANDKRIKKVFDWLLAIRQDDGGWALPLRTKGYKLEVILGSKTIEPDKSQPFSHLITGIVLRAFAAHPHHQHTPAATAAGKLLASRFFQKDVYTDLRSPKAWETFSYPFWNTDLLSSLDVLSKLGFSKKDPNIVRATEWLCDHQRANGLLDVHKNHDRYHDQHLWLTLALCRALKQFET